ncbi:MAG: hypothetical protein WC556_08810 [Candidatus Methanoperedens sp.]
MDSIELYMSKNSKQKTINKGDETLEFLSIIEPAWSPDAEVRYG